MYSECGQPRASIGLLNSILELRLNTRVKYEHIFQTVEYQVPAIKLLKKIIEKREIIMEKLQTQFN